MLPMFVGSLSSNMFLGCILLLSRITRNFKTFIDSISSTHASTEVNSGYLTATISEYLPQFLIFFNSATNKSNFFEWKCSWVDHIAWAGVLTSSKKLEPSTVLEFFAPPPSVLELFSPHSAFGKNMKMCNKWKKTNKIKRK